MRNNKQQKTNTDGHRRFWVIGAGRFGQIAVRRITNHISGAEIRVVDQCLPESGLENTIQIRADGVVWLKAMLSADIPVDMIIPAIPVHVAAGWIRLMLSDRYDIRSLAIPADWLAQLPHAMPGPPGQAYVSHADFICPDSCPEPADRCTYTGKPRPKDMFRLLAECQLDDVLPIVLRSHQLLPGVGGLLPADLISALKLAERNYQHSLMIATACRCHGVVDFMRLIKRIPNLEEGVRFS